MKKRDQMPYGLGCWMPALLMSQPGFAGDLNPPPGPVSPTMKTLAHVEPRTCVDAVHTPGDDEALFVISRPGSYYLTENVVGEAGKHGIAIDAGQVTLDLSGFDVVGGAGTMSGVFVREAVEDVVVFRGAVCGWEVIGVDLTNAGFTVASDLHASGCGSGLVCGNRARVERCTAHDNQSGGILTGRSCVVDDCTVSFNTRYGIYVLESSRVRGCLSEGNGDHGLYLDGDGCAVSECSLVSNGLHGVAAIYGGSIERTTAEHNGGDGFWSLGALAISDSRATSNGGDGIYAGNGSTVTGCVARDNAGDGIEIAGDVRAANNHAVRNTSGAGLRITGSASHVEGNTLLANKTGLVCGSTGNFIVRNTASGNAVRAYDIAAGNAYGRILNVAGVGAFDEALGPVSAWANFEY